MRKILENLCNTLEACIEVRGGPKDPTVQGIAANTLLFGVRGNLRFENDLVYCNTPAGRMDADALVNAINYLMPVVLR